MSLATLMRYTATITVRDTGTIASTDEYGNPVYATADIAVACFWEQRSSNEVQDPPGEVQQEEVLLVVPAGTVIKGWDSVAITGIAFDVIGPPWRVTNPRTGVESHVEAILRMTA